MSTSITKGSWQIIVFDQKEMLSELRYWVVQVWEDYDQDVLSNCLWSDDNFDWDSYKETDITLESLISKALEFIKGEQK